MPKLVGRTKHSGPTLTGGIWKRKQGHLIAELELGAWSHGETRWVELHYALGSLPKVGLGKPLQKHRQSVLPGLVRESRARRYKKCLDRRIKRLQ